jgi:hypothetical protein
MKKLFLMAPILGLLASCSAPSDKAAIEIVKTYTGITEISITGNERQVCKNYDYGRKWSGKIVNDTINGAVCKSYSTVYVVFYIE